MLQLSPLLLYFQNSSIIHETIRQVHALDIGKTSLISKYAWHSRNDGFKTFVLVDIDRIIIILFGKTLTCAINET